MAKKPEYKGDGLKFNKAVSDSGKTIAEFIEDSEFTMGTLYRLFKQETIDDDTKLSAAKALGRTIDEIFGAKDDKPTKKHIPMIGDALAGVDMEINVKDSNYVEQYIDVGDLLRDSEAAFTVYGNSMTPAYPSGCIVGIKRNYDKFIQPGETYMLVTKSNRVFKRLYYNDDKTGYTCFSDNTLKHESGPMEGKYFYPPFDIKGDDVIAVYDIMGMIKRNRNSGVMHRQS